MDVIEHELYLLSVKLKKETFRWLMSQDKIISQCVHVVGFVYSQVHRRPKCDTHGHFCLIFGNIAIFTNSSTLISKIIAAKLSSCVKMVFWGI